MKVSISPLLKGSGVNPEICNDWQHFGFLPGANVMLEDNHGLAPVDVGLQGRSFDIVTVFADALELLL